MYILKATDGYSEASQNLVLRAYKVPLMMIL